MIILRASATAAIVVGLHVALAPVAWAQRTPAEATQHAYEELANAIAQGKITRTPTPSPTLTLTPTAIITATPLVMQTDTPTATPSPVATSEPCWLLDDQRDVVFDQDGAPVPCPTEVAQVLPENGPPDDGLDVAPDATPVPEVPPPPNPNYPNAAPQAPVVIVIIATPAPIPALPPQIVYEPGPAPTALPAEVIYLVVTPTPMPRPTVSVPLPTPASTAMPTEQPAQMHAPAVAVAAARASVPPPSPRVPVNPDHMPPPMLLSFGLLWTRRRVQDETPEWLAVLDVEDE